jgi:ribosomal protein S14
MICRVKFRAVAKQPNISLVLEGGTVSGRCRCRFRHLAAYAHVCDI